MEYTNENKEINEFSIVKKSIVYTLDDLYKSGYIKGNLLDVRKYNNILEFNKKIGFRIFRNPEGNHKISTDTEKIQNIIKDPDKQRRFCESYITTIAYVAKL